MEIPFGGFEWRYTRTHALNFVEIVGFLDGFPMTKITNRFSAGVKKIFWSTRESMFVECTSASGDFNFLKIVKQPKVLR